MTKDESLKKFELRVSVICCDGCKKKVLKALSIKGVIHIEIDQNLPKVIVTGNVEANTLIKKLAKIGKKAELWEADKEAAKNPEQGNKSNSENGNGCSCGENGDNNKKPEDQGAILYPAFYASSSVPSHARVYYPINAYYVLPCEAQYASFVDFYNEERRVGCHIL